jgi:hypothetical protein
MKHRVPAVAKWLLRHFGCGPNNVAVIGDLDERYQNGRGPAWYWRQVLYTIVQSLLSEIWRVVGEFLKSGGDRRLIESATVLLPSVRSQV